MRLLVQAMCAAAALTGCGGNPFAAGGGTPAPVPTGVDAKVARNMTSASYVGNELRINLNGLISSGTATRFDRDPTLDLLSAGAGQPNYLAFVYQETALQRSYVAFLATNQRGNLLAVQTTDGGQFNEHNDGGYYARTGEYTRPSVVDGTETGQFSYIGTYAGLFAPGPTNDSIRPPNLRPGKPLRVTGTAQINVRFGTATTSSGMLEGGIVDRQVLDDSGARITSITVNSGTIDLTNKTVYPDLVLRENVVDANGRFIGDVEYQGSPGNIVGNYGGLFGGLNATDVAGVLWLNPVVGNRGIFEHGVFNLPRCDLAGSAPLCIPR